MQLVTEGARKRAALETYVRHEATLRRTARRYSLCEDDADDALQRALEILLTKAPSEDPRELIRWTQTVVKHEALAVRRERERIFSGPAAVAAEPGREDWVALLPSRTDGPPERAERREEIARSREALQTLKPQERRALTLLAEGYSYVEIGEITGFSHTKINRCLAEGRERFRKFLAGSEDGSRCKQMAPLLSAFCDGETSPEETVEVREHLNACVSCKATLRTYRAAPRAAAALAPVLPLSRSLFERVHDALGEIAARFGRQGGGGDAALSQVATGGGAGGAGLAGMAKTVALCAGAGASAAACVVTGIVPTPFEVGHPQAPALERQVERPSEASESAEVAHEPPAAETPQRKSKPGRSEEARPLPTSEAEATPAVTAEVPPEPAPEPEPVPTAEPSTEISATPASSGGPAGEFGP